MNSRTHLVLALAALVLDVWVVACAGAQRESASQQPKPAAPDPPIHDPSLQCTTPLPAVLFQAMARDDAGLAADAGAPEDSGIAEDSGPSVRGSGGMQRPDFGGPPKVAFPAKALEQRVSGVVVATCIITDRGTVENCCIDQGLPYMDRAVVEALEAMHGRPVTFNGKAVRVQYTFNLRLRPNPQQ